MAHGGQGKVKGQPGVDRVAPRIHNTRHERKIARHSRLRSGLLPQIVVQRGLEGGVGDEVSRGEDLQEGGNKRKKRWVFGLHGQENRRNAVQKGGFD